MTSPAPCREVLPALQVQVQYFPHLKDINCWRMLNKFIIDRRCVLRYFLILAHNANAPSAKAADNFPVIKLNLLQTRKRCKRPSAKRAPGRHPGLFQISRLFRTRFPADFSPGQKEQPMFWFKDNRTYEVGLTLLDSFHVKLYPCKLLCRIKSLGGKTAGSDGDRATHSIFPIE